MEVQWWMIALVPLAAIVYSRFIAPRLGRRRAVREKFLAYLAERGRGIEVLEATPATVVVRAPGGVQMTIRLARIYAVAAEQKDDGDALESIFEAFVASVLESDAAGAIDPQRDLQRLMPRVVPDEFLKACSDAQPEADLASVPFTVQGLSIALVVNDEHSVRYVSRDMLKDLGLELPEAVERAKANLRAVTSPLIVKAVVEENDMNLVKLGDTFEAARVILLPEFLNPGERIIALIPDRDTLTLLPYPKESDWPLLEKLARDVSHGSLWSKPVVVTAEGATGR